MARAVPRPQRPKTLLVAGDEPQGHPLDQNVGRGDSAAAGGRAKFGQFDGQGLEWHLALRHRDLFPARSTIARVCVGAHERQPCRQ